MASILVNSLSEAKETTRARCPGRHVTRYAQLRAFRARRLTPVEPVQGLMTSYEWSLIRIGKLRAHRGGSQGSRSVQTAHLSTFLPVGGRAGDWLAVVRQIVERGRDQRSARSRPGSLRFGARRGRRGVLVLALPFVGKRSARSAELSAGPWPSLAAAEVSPGIAHPSSRIRGLDRSVGRAGAARWWWLVGEELAELVLVIRRSEWRVGGEERVRVWRGVVEPPCAHAGSGVSAGGGQRPVPVPLGETQRP